MGSCGVVVRAGECVGTCSRWSDLGRGVASRVERKDGNYCCFLSETVFSVSDSFFLSQTVFSVSDSKRLSETEKNCVKYLQFPDPVRVQHSELCNPTLLIPADYARPPFLDPNPHFNLCMINHTQIKTTAPPTMFVSWEKMMIATESRPLHTSVDGGD